MSQHMPAMSRNESRTRLEDELQGNPRRMQELRQRRWDLDARDQARLCSLVQGETWRVLKQIKEQQRESYMQQLLACEVEDTPLIRQKVKALEELFSRIEEVVRQADEEE